MIRIIHSRRVNVLSWHCRLGFPVAAMALFMCGCAQRTQLKTASLQQQISAESAFVMPPPGGPAVVSVLQKRFTNGIEQTVFLATESNVPGQNSFRVQIAGNQDNSPDTLTSLKTRPLALSAPSRDGRVAIPGVPMRRSAYFVKNRYGPFGYMSGRSGKDRCLYAWQQIRARAAIVGERGSIDIRLRLCRSGATEAQLLSVMYGYTINGYVPQAIWNPYDEVGAPPEDLATAGTEVFAPAESGVRHDLATPDRTRPRVPAAPVSLVGAKKVQPRGPMVPPPPTGEPHPVVPAPPASSR